MGIPFALKKGDKVAVLATAKRLESSYDKGVEQLKHWGFEPILYDSVNSSSGYFAGNDLLRQKDFQDALDNPEVKAVLFLRGGYGSTRILDLVDFSIFKRNPKWLIGFSDITSILLHTIALSIPVIHGQVAITVGRDKNSDQAMYRIISGELCFDYPLEESHHTREGKASGKIVGGNLSMVCESIAAKNEINTDGNIVFLEEIGEELYAIDRMMNKLKRIGKFRNLTGVILGSFTSITDRQGYWASSVEEVLMSYFTDLDIPVACGLNAGHEKINYPLILGHHTEIEVTKGSLGIEYIK